MAQARLDPAIQATLDDVHEHWPEFEPNELFDPVTIALDIAEARTDRGKSLRELEQQTKRLENDVNKLVNEHHLGFNNSIQTFSSVVAHVTDAQKRVNQLKRDLLEARHFLQLLRTRREGLSRLWTKTIECKEMSRLLGQIDELKRMPKRISEHFQNQQYLHAVDCLNMAMKLINSDGIVEIGALSDIRRLLDEHREIFPGKLTDEMISFLFLRTSSSASTGTRRTGARTDQLFADELSDDGETNETVADIGDDISALDLDDQFISNSGSNPANNMDVASVSTISLAQQPDSISGSASGFLALSPLTISVAKRGQSQGTADTAARSVRRGNIHLADPAVALSKVSTGLGRKLKPTDEVTEDLDKIASSDPMRHLAILIDCLGKLNELPNVARLIERTLKLELFQVVENSVNDIEATELSGINGYMSSVVTTRFDASVTAMSATNSPAHRAKVLRGLLTTLYRKYRVIYKRCQFVYERINYRLRLTPEHWLSLDQVWEAMQEELESVLSDYLQDSMRSGRRKDASPTTPVSGNKQEPRVMMKTRMFSLANTEASKIMSAHFRDLKRTEDRRVAASETMDDVYLGMAAGSGGHRLLLQPDPLNIALLYRPTELFTSKMMKAVNKGSRSTAGMVDCRLQAFVNDFVLEDVIPLIREKVLFQMSASIKYGSGSAPTKTELFIDSVSERPLLKSAVVVLWLVRELCKIMTAVPLHYNEYVSLVQILLVEYLNTCERQFNAVTEASSKPVIASAATPTSADSSSSEVISRQWSQAPGVRKHLQRHPLLHLTLPSAGTSASSSTLMRLDDLINEDQTLAELEIKGNQLLNREELIWDPARMLLIASLHHSLTWLTEQLEGMRAAALDEHTPVVLALAEDVNLTLIDLDNVGTSMAPSGNVAGTGNVQTALGGGRTNTTSSELTNAIGAAMFLLMDDENKSGFDEIMERIRSMAKECLFVLRTEIRSHVHFFIDLATREGTHAPASEVVEPDPYIVSLNKDMSSLEDALSRRLRDPALLFVFDGVPQLLSALLCADAKYITKVNQYGVLKMARNVFALQKCLSATVAPGIILDRYLDRVRQFYGMLDYDAENLAAYVAANQAAFSPSELETALQLILRNIESLGHDVLGFSHAVEQLLMEVSKRATFWTSSSSRQHSHSPS